MVDERLRALERRWKETGSVDDEAAFLRARVQAGELTDAQLRLAAHAGHPAARRVVGAPAELPHTDAELHAWADGFGAFEPLEPLVGARAALAIAREVQPSGGAEPLVAAALDAAEAWCVCPCEEHWMPARLARRWVSQAAFGEPPSYRAWLLELVDRAVDLIDADRPADLLGGLMQTALTYYGPSLVTRTAAELAPWALGGDDPLRRRHHL